MYIVITIAICMLLIIIISNFNSKDRTFVDVIQDTQYIPIDCPPWAEASDGTCFFFERFVPIIKVRVNEGAPTIWPPQDIFIHKPVEKDVPYICTKDWNCQIAIDIIWCESRWVHDVIGPINFNGTRDYGLFQINQIHAASYPDFWHKWSNPAYNIDVAFDIYTNARGWSPWSCY